MANNFFMKTNSLLISLGLAFLFVSCKIQAGTTKAPTSPTKTIPPSATISPTQTDTPLPTPTHQDIAVTSDKIEYSRNDKAVFTITNSSTTDIFFRSSNSRVLNEIIQLEFQRYNHKSKNWEVFSLQDIIRDSQNWTEPIRPEGQEEILILYNHSVYFNVPREPEDRLYRLVAYYYPDDSCSGISYWDNEEFCETRLVQAISNEFIIKGLGGFYEATNFCQAIDDEYVLDESYFLSFDKDEEQEIVGVCWHRLGQHIGTLFILDRRDKHYESILEIEGETGQRYYTFSNLEIIDIDEDGIDEILYQEIGWWMAGATTYLHLYSPEHQIWFWIMNWREMKSTEDGEIIEEKGIELSPDLESEIYKIFREYLLERMPSLPRQE